MKVTLNRFKKHITLGLLTGFWAIGVVSPSLAEFDAAKTFENKCSSCHTIGQGDLKGPDLKGIEARRKPEWLVSFIQSSYTLIQSGDPEAVAVFNKYQQKEMPDQRLTKDEVMKLIEFIAKGVVADAGSVGKSANSAKPEDVAAGELLYKGEVALASGGPSCISCHSVGHTGVLGGGTLAKDLTHAYSAFGDKGIDQALKKLAFPVMETVFADKPLTEGEIFQIKAFLYDADQKNVEVATAGFDKKFIFLGLGGGVLAMGIIDFTWRRRRKHSVRKGRGGLR